MCRGENPEGEWTIRVSDQDIEEEEGFFLGWELSLWGSVIDPAKAHPYVLKDTDFKPFPPPEPVHEPEPETTSASTTKSYLKPTIVHSLTTGADGMETTTTVGVVPGEDDHEKGSFDGDGTITHESDLNDPRFFAAIAGFVLFIVLAGIAVYFIMRQKVKKHNGDYSTVPGSDEEAGALPMTSLEDGRRASRPDVIYDEGEENRLVNSERRKQEVSSSSVGFHSGFLDDDDETSEVATQPYSDTQERRS